MIQWAPYIFVRIVLCFSAGILWQIYGRPAFDFLPAAVAAGTLLFVGLHLFGVRKASELTTQLAGIIGLGVIFLFGSLITRQRTEKYHPQHFIQQPQAVTHYTGVISDFVVEKPRHYNLVVRVKQVRTAAGWRPATGKVLLMLRKEATLAKPRYGDVLLVQGRPAVPTPPLNPYAFNYRQYLAYQQIYHQQYAWPAQVKVIGNAPPSQVMALGIQLRSYFDAVLHQHVPGQRNYAIATALVLGMKEYLDADIKAAYTRTGTTHVLAVSGLHVALLFLALNFMLGRLARTRRQKLVVFVALLGIMWLYALITALSASVLRAVVMFSLLSGAKFFKRRSNMYNVLAGTAFGLLVYNPFFLLDVGFQLSFAAVLGIVFWQPRLSRLLTFDNWLGNKLWEGVTASVAAQLATAPLALYYFHQFPVYFLVANLFAVIISEGVLYVGFLLLAFSWAPYVNAFLGKLMGGLLDAMNAVVLALEKLPFALIENISLSVGQAWLLAGFLVLSSWFLLYRRRVFLLAAAGALVISSGWQWAKKYEQQQQQLWVVYHLKKHAGLAFIQGRAATLLADSAVYANPANVAYTIQPHWVQMGIATARYATPVKPLIPAFTTPAGNTCLVWHGLRVLIIGQPEHFTARPQPLALDYILVRNNANVNPGQLLRAFRFKTLISDASNAPWYARNLRAACARQRIPFYDVSTQGAFVGQW